jgi:hypothetical protein
MMLVVVIFQSFLRQIGLGDDVRDGPQTAAARRLGLPA